MVDIAIHILGELYIFEMQQMQTFVLDSFII